MLLTRLSMTTLLALKFILYIHNTYIINLMSTLLGSVLKKHQQKRLSAVFAQANLTTHNIVHLVFNAYSQGHLWPENGV